MNSAYVLYGIAVLSIILGFIALLSQKIYVDETTKQPTEVEVPFLGKIKSNYPALVFVFLGAVLAFGAFQKSYPPEKEEWTLKGQFAPPTGEAVDPTSSLDLSPVSEQTQIDDKGIFQIKVRIPRGTSLEDAFETVEYTYKGGSGRIDLGKEYKMFLNNDKESKISNATQHERIFKPIPITTISQ
jgi:hypothetical protein